MKKFSHYLASANTGIGFFSSFDSILEKEKNGYTFVLKGGPGTGKSTLMKKVSDHFAEKGFSIERFYCSSDASSLDGIRIVEKNVSIIDGTKPHAFDPTCPKIDGEVVNLGDFVKSDVRNDKIKIEKLLSEKQQRFESFYETMKSAYHIFNSSKALLNKTFNESKLNKTANNVFTMLADRFDFQKSTPFQPRKLFLDYVGEGGLEGFFFQNHFLKAFEVDDNFVNTSAIFVKISKKLEKCGEKTILIQNTINPDMFDCLLCPERDFVILSTNNVDSLSLSDREFLEGNSRVLDEILLIAGSFLSEARKCHFEIEKCFIGNIDTDGLNRTCDRIVSNIETNF